MQRNAVSAGVLVWMILVASVAGLARQASSPQQPALNPSLDRATFEPHARRGWQAIVKALHDDGKLGWVQQIGAEPGSATFESTEVYGVGALLLAGSEVQKLAR